jgi:hypothetical protein
MKMDKKGSKFDPFYSTTINHARPLKNQEPNWAKPPMPVFEAWPILYSKDLYYLVQRSFSALVSVIRQIIVLLV